MLLDKVKSMVLALALGLMAAVITALALFKLAAGRHGVALGDALALAQRRQLGLWPAELLAAAAFALAVGVGVTTLLWWLLRSVRWTYRHRSLDSAEAAADLHVRGTPPNKPRIFAGRFGGKPLYASVEDRGLVIGPPGTGKTAFLVNQILQASRNGLSFAVVDLKPELHRILAPSLRAAGYRVLRVNPARDEMDADHWNPLADVDDETDITELCGALLPIRDAKEAPFVEAQRDWLRAAVFHVKTQPSGSLPAAFNLLSSQSNPLELLALLERSSSATAARLARRMAAGLAGAKPDPLILQGLTGCLRTLDYLGLPSVQAALRHSDFSARELGKRGKVALFLQFEEAKIGALGPLLAFAAAGLLTALIDTAGQREPVALFLDELGNMPPIPGLAEKLNTIRSRHIPTWMYFQTAEQIERRFGRGAAAVFFASADVQTVFRLNDHETRKLISDLVGVTERKRYAEANSGQVTVTHENVAVIHPHELGQLAVGQVVCLYRGASAKGYATPYFVEFPAFRR
ncbi:type IV secretory system conjugative DNA transfer family protein [Ralstonia sp. 22111]|uniref:type IV secretory system conjugative DNA transfer family protein n=1 Tax=Ralstonia sp. 22111 TaxID=3453878 RepID=UPI003F85F39A